MLDFLLASRFVSRGHTTKLTTNTKCYSVSYRQLLLCARQDAICVPKPKQVVFWAFDPEV